VPNTTITYEVCTEGVLEEWFDDLAEAKEFIDALNDGVLPLQLVKVTREIVETRNQK